VVIRTCVSKKLLLIFTVNADVRLEMYQPVIGQAPLIDSLFVRLHKKVMIELQFQAELERAKGALSMMMSCSLASMS
jgi:U3 small nucleolar RNA-associated protein 15